MPPVQSKMAVVVLNPDPAPLQSTTCAAATAFAATRAHQAAAPTLRTPATSRRVFISLPPMPNRPARERGASLRRRGVNRACELPVVPYGAFLALIASHWDVRFSKMPDRRVERPAKQ